MTVLETMRAFGGHDIDEVTFPVRWRFDGEADGDEIRCMGFRVEGDWLSEALYWLGDGLEDAWYGEPGDRSMLTDEWLPKDNGRSFMNLYEAAEDAVLVITLRRIDAQPLTTRPLPNGGTVTDFEPPKYIATACGERATDDPLSFCLQELGKQIMRQSR